MILRIGNSFYKKRQADKKKRPCNGCAFDIFGTNPDCETASSGSDCGKSFIWANYKAKPKEFKVSKKKFQFVAKEAKKKGIKTTYKKSGRRVLVIKDGKTVNHFDSVADCAYHYGISISTVSKYMGSGKVYDEIGVIFKREEKK